MSAFTITSARRRPYSERLIHNGFNLFVESNATKLIDEFFNENKIWSLDFKSKTWAKLKRMACKLETEAMKDFFGAECEMKFSHYTGCSMCPCSPGYKVRKAFAEPFWKYANNDVWAKINVDVSSIKSVLPKMKEMLEAEIKANTK